MRGGPARRCRNLVGPIERTCVAAAEFLWLIIQHVLPKGFRRARNFGFLHPNRKRLIALLHVLLKFDPGPASGWIRPRPAFLCACCGAVTKIVRTQIRSRRPEHSAAIAPNVPTDPVGASTRPPPRTRAHEPRSRLASNLLSGVHQSTPQSGLL